MHCTGIDISIEFWQDIHSSLPTCAVTRDDRGRVQGAPHDDATNVRRAVVSLGANPLLFQVVDADCGALAASQLLPSSGQPVMWEVRFYPFSHESLDSKLAHARAVTDDGLGAVTVDVDLPVAVAFY